MTRMGIRFGLRNGLAVVRAQGLPWTLFRLRYELGRRTGRLRRRLPQHEWVPLDARLRAGVPAEPSAYLEWRRAHTRFFLEPCPPGSFPFPEAGNRAAAEARHLLKGKWAYFSTTVFDVGFPPNWHLNPLTGTQLPATSHWSDIDDFALGDVKLVWEPSRFAAAYLLVRAYAATGDDCLAEAFWTLAEDWAEKNPPQSGPNWKCGQETSFRVMAWCFALHGLAASPATTPHRVAWLASVLAEHGERIEGNIAYARSQNNNHAISEAAGLWTLGTLFPEFTQAERWRDTGYALLRETATRQVYRDGSYVQHSFNYHRLMLHDYVWALRLGEVNNSRLHAEVYSAVERAASFLANFIDPETGQVPNIGQNDGALILPLNDCGYTDYRPVVQAACFAAGRRYAFPPGPWDEDLFWLFGPSAVCRTGGSGGEHARTPSSAAHAPSYAAPEGGLYLLRGENSRVVVRCVSYRDRPAQADQLHFDLSWHGLNLLCDAGTYLYNGDPPWRNGLASAFVHNTVTVDDRDQMDRMGAFLWIRWASGKAGNQPGRDGNWFEGEHDGYRALRVTHRRAVAPLGSDAWLIVDDLCGVSGHRARLHWLIADLPWEMDATDGHLQLGAPAGPFRLSVWASEAAQHSLFRAGELAAGSMPGGAPDRNAVRGWRSLSYGVKEPALSLACEAAMALPARFITVAQPAALPAFVASDNLREVSNGQTTARLAAAGHPGIIAAVEEVR